MLTRHVAQDGWFYSVTSTVVLLVVVEREHCSVLFAGAKCNLHYFSFFQLPNVTDIVLFSGTRCHMHSAFLRY